MFFQKAISFLYFLRELFCFSYLRIFALQKIEIGNHSLYVPTELSCTLHDKIEKVKKWEQIYGYNIRYSRKELNEGNTVCIGITVFKGDSALLYLDLATDRFGSLKSISLISSIDSEKILDYFYQHFDRNGIIKHLHDDDFLLPLDVISKLRLQAITRS